MDCKRVVAAWGASSPWVVLLPAAAMVWYKAALFINNLNTMWTTASSVQGGRVLEP